MINLARKSFRGASVASTLISIGRSSPANAGAAVPRNATNRKNWQRRERANTMLLLRELDAAWRIGFDADCIPDHAGCNDFSGWLACQFFPERAESRSQSCQLWRPLMPKLAALATVPRWLAARIR